MKKHISFAEIELRAYIEGVQVPVLSTALFYRENANVTCQLSITVSDKMQEFFDIVLKNRPLVVVTALHRNETKYKEEAKEIVMFIGTVYQYSFVIAPSGMTIDLVAYDLLAMLNETTIYELNPATVFIDVNRALSSSQMSTSIDKFKEMVSKFIVSGFRESIQSLLGLHALYSKEEPEEKPESYSDMVQNAIAKLRSGALEDPKSGEGCKYQKTDNAVILGQKAVDIYGGRDLYTFDDNGNTTGTTQYYDIAKTKFNQYKDKIQKVASDTGVPPGLIFGILCRENGSSNHPDGLMQITKGSGYRSTDTREFREFKQFMESKGYNITPDDIVKNDEIAIYCAAFMLKQLHDRTGDWRLATMAYNGGENSTYRRLIESAGGSPSGNVESMRRQLFGKNGELVVDIDVCKFVRDALVDGGKHDKINAAYVSTIFGQGGYVELWDKFGSGGATSIDNEKYKKKAEEITDPENKPKDESKPNESDEEVTVDLESSTPTSSIMDIYDIMQKIPNCTKKLDLSKSTNLYWKPSTEYDETKYGPIPMLSEYRNFIIESMWIPEDTSHWKAYYYGIQLLMKNNNGMLNSRTTTVWQLIQYILDMANYQIVPIVGGGMMRSYVDKQNKDYGPLKPIFWAFMPKLTMADYDGICVETPETNVFYSSESPANFQYSVNAVERATALAGMLNAPNMFTGGNQKLSTMKVVMPIELYQKIKDQDSGDIAFRTTYTSEEEWRGPTRVLQEYGAFEIGLSVVEKLKAAKSQGMDVDDNQITVESENISTLILMHAMKDYFERVVGNQGFSFSLGYWPYLVLGMPARFETPTLNIYGIITSATFVWSSHGLSCNVVFRNAYTDWDNPQRVFESLDIQSLDPWFNNDDYNNIKKLMLGIGIYDADFRNSTSTEIALDKNVRSRNMVTISDLSENNLKKIGRSPLRIRKEMREAVRRYSAFLKGIGMGEAWELLRKYTTTVVDEPPTWVNLDKFE